MGFLGLESEHLSQRFWIQLTLLDPHRAVGDLWSVCSRGWRPQRTVLSAFLPSVQQLGGSPGPRTPLRCWPMTCEKKQSKHLGISKVKCPHLPKGLAFSPEYLMNQLLPKAALSIILKSSDRLPRL